MYGKRPRPPVFRPTNTPRTPLGGPFSLRAPFLGYFSCWQQAPAALQSPSEWELRLEDTVKK